MKLKLKRQDFIKAWQIAEKVAETKTTKEATSGIFITASDDGQVILEATDLKTSVRCKAEGAEVIEPGFALVPSVILGSMIKKSASEELDLEVTSERGFLKAANSSAKFSVISAEEFPKIPESSGAEEICSIMASDLAKLISEGGSSASQPTDFPKYIGTCLLRTQNGYVKIVSTDGKRLSLSQFLCGNISKDEDTLLPAPALKELGKTLSLNYGGEEVKILADGSTVWFNLENVEFSIRRIEASFPVYERILNDTVKTSLKIKSSELIPVLERIDIIAKTTTAHIMAMFLNPNGELKITARAPEKGTASEIINAEISGEVMNIGFNVNYFMDGLKVMGPDEVYIEFSDEEGQARMKRMKGDAVDQDLLYMLMPARLSAQDRIADDEMNEINNTDAPEENQNQNENWNEENNNSEENHEGENYQQ